MTYFHIETRPHAPRRAWHAEAPSAFPHVALCGFVSGKKVAVPAYRVPPAAHFCGNCARLMARARARAYEDTTYGVVAPV